jgi:hypothetical protein
MEYQISEQFNFFEFGMMELVKKFPDFGVVLLIKKPPLINFKGGFL